MDDIFDSLIYIIITIVAFGISALGKKKKKATQRPVFPAQKQEPNVVEEKPFLSNLEELLKEEIGFTNNTIKEEVTFDPIMGRKEIYEKEEVLDSVPTEMLDDKVDVPYSIEYEDTNEIFSKSISDKDISDENEDEILEEFNLRDAVIYSEIMNRREY